MKRFKVFVFVFTVVGFLFPVLVLAQQGTMDWALATDSAGWSERYDHTTVTFDNKIWVLGGNASDGSRKNDVWYSNDGVNWILTNDSAGWSRRNRHAAVVFDNKIWVLGGNASDRSRKNDVWYSSDGINWTCATESAGWSRRYSHTAVVFDNKIWVMGGSASDGNRKNDVWYSADGINWTQATASAGWSPRLDHTSVVFDNKIWILGGDASILTETDRNDVWYSTDGINWTCATPSAAWARRDRHASVSFDNKIWVLGGSSRRNDVWYSSDGVDWTCATNSASWTRRRDHASLVFNNKMWVLGGNSRSNDVWYSNGYSATLISPNGGETLPGGSTYTIRWNANAIGISRFRLLLSRDGGLTYMDTIADNILPSETTYQWTVPFLNLHNARVAVQILDSLDAVLLQDASDNNFSIQTIKVISPNGNETLTGGDNWTIHWRTFYPNFSWYRLLLIRDYSYPDTIANNLTHSDTLYNWTVPLINSTLCRILVQMLDSNGVAVLEDASDNYFTIHTISLLAPNGNEFWAGGSNKIIKWRTTTPISFSHYRLLLSTDGGSTFPYIIANNVSSTESTYIYLVPNLNSDICIVKVQIMNTSDSTLCEDESDDYFTIDSDPPETFSLLLPQNNGWAGNNSVFAWQPTFDNFAMSHYQLSIVIPNETLQVTTRDTTFINNQGEAWIQATNSAPWTERSHHSSVVFNNRIWVMGGDDGDDIRNDIWYSLDGANWTQATASAGWSPRFSHTSVVFNNRIWVMGGDGEDDVLNDVWYSMDGVNWIQAIDSTGWSPRCGHTSLVFDNKMWVLGGTDYDYEFNDVWYSTDGVNWTQTTASAEWNTREGHTSVVFDNKMWVIGGDWYNDVWYSADGINWTCATDSAAWAGRQCHTSVVFDNNIWVLGGSWYNDVWYSSDGTNWTCSTPSANWFERIGHTSVVFDNKMWVIGGDNRNDVWYSYIPLLIPEGTQTWWVTAFDRAGNVRQSNEIFLVRIDTTLPIATTLISPNDSTVINDSFITFIWHSSSDIPSGIFAYRLQVSDDPYFTPLLDLDTIIHDTIAVTLMSNFNLTYWWQVCAIDSADNQGSWSLARMFTVQITGIEENPFPQIPYILSLKVYPSPAKSLTIIRYSLPVKSNVALVIYDITGRLIKTLVQGQKNPGIYNSSLNTKELSAGIYFVSLQTNKPQKIIERLVIVK